MKKSVLWGVWLIMTASIGGYYGYRVFASRDKQELLVGETSYGHFQIEMACSACHGSAFGGMDGLQKACVRCHGEELARADDSHPKSKFTDPRNADRLEFLDARFCVTCHIEHQRELTHDMGVSLPGDFCWYCHQDIAEDRASHKAFPFDSCAGAGCHNFHDNLALYEDFLIQHSGGPDLQPLAQGPLRNAEDLYREKHPDARALNAADIDAPANLVANNRGAAEVLHQEWLDSSHARNGVNCSGCHRKQDGIWTSKPGHRQCESCHEDPVKDFLAGKHGMRLAFDFEAISPSESHLDFRDEAKSQRHGCTACHRAHRFDTRRAATESCLACHNDQHSLAFKDSPHFALWQQELSGKLPEGRGVSCASCHLPRETHTRFEQRAVIVQHNQNANLRPNEKMIRAVCMNCHSLRFSIDALADSKLISNNFKGQPAVHIESIDMALRREARH
ncbi:MAG: cytochrome c3 family protein [Methylococcaceae bacterium]|nr:cytochrome c3 family protein [Methylococcaceae bacterium]